MKIKKLRKMVEAQEDKVHRATLKMWKLQEQLQQELARQAAPSSKPKQRLTVQ